MTGAEPEPSRAVREALLRYRGQSAAVRFHTRVRAFTCPFAPLVERLPREGRLLEVGCGHGLFSLSAALRHRDLTVLGVDPSLPKVEAAQAAAAAIPNASFRASWLADVGDHGFAVVAVLDVLYLVPREQRVPFLRDCHARLAPTGRLLLKEVDVTPRWKFRKCAAQEQLSVRVLGITLGAEFAYAGVAETSAALRDAGFAAPVVTRLDRGYSTPHILYEAVRA